MTHLFRTRWMLAAGALISGFMAGLGLASCQVDVSSYDKYGAASLCIPEADRAPRVTEDPAVLLFALTFHPGAPPNASTQSDPELLFALWSDGLTAHKGVAGDGGTIALGFLRPIARRQALWEIQAIENKTAMTPTLKHAGLYAPDQPFIRMTLMNRVSASMRKPLTIDVGARDAGAFAGRGFADAAFCLLGSGMQDSNYFMAVSAWLAGNTAACHIRATETVTLEGAPKDIQERIAVLLSDLRLVWHTRD